MKETSPPGPAADFYPDPIELDRLREGVPNRVRLDGETDAVAVLTKDGLKVMRDLCTHMGAPLSEGRFCAEEGTLQCPWHGYLYSCVSGELLRNPNDDIFAPLKGRYAAYKPEKRPRYRLQRLSFEIVGRLAYVRKGAPA